jgi:hypothetical protein
MSTSGFSFVIHHISLLKIIWLFVIVQRLHILNLYCYFIQDFDNHDLWLMRLFLLNSASILETISEIPDAAIAKALRQTTHVIATYINKAKLAFVCRIYKANHIHLACAAIH